MKKENNFDKLLLKTIDTSLKEIFTETAASAIYAFLENNYTLNREELPEKIDVFEEGLRRFLSTGAFTVERVILEKLYSALECKYKLNGETDFKSSIMQLRNSFRIS
ncbi:MAG: hypothetical protein ACUVT5_00300 [Candidatus Bathyarchaeales archaeon]